MPIECEWMNEGKTVLYIGLSGKLEAEDFLDSDVKTCAMLDSVDHPVDVIIDYTRQVYFSAKYVDTSSKMTLDHKHMRSVIFLGNKLAWELFDVYVTQYQGVAFRYAYAATMEKAYELIDQIRIETRLEGRRPNSPELN